jgi:defect-in-organelle-trafficking protein DotD
MRVLLIEPVLALTGLILLAGCAADPKVPAGVDTTGMPNTELALQESLRQVDAAMATLGTMTPASVALSDNPVVPAELQKIVTFAWQGPLDGAVRQLAASIGYTVKISGSQHRAALAVGVDSGPKPIVELFRDLGTAAGDRATIELDPQHHRVEVRHHV